MKQGGMQTSKSKRIVTSNQPSTLCDCSGHQRSNLESFFSFGESMFSKINLFAYLLVPWWQMMTTSNNQHHQQCSNQATHDGGKRSYMKHEWLAAPETVSIKSQAIGGRIVKHHSAQPQNPWEPNMVENGTTKKGAQKWWRDGKREQAPLRQSAPLRHFESEKGRCVCGWLCVGGWGPTGATASLAVLPYIYPSSLMALTMWWWLREVSAATLTQ